MSVDQCLTNEAIFEAVLEYKRLSGQNFFNLENLVFEVRSLLQSVCSRNPLSFALVHGPTGSGKTTLYNLLVFVFQHCQLLHFVLPNDMASESLVEEALMAVQTTENKDTPFFEECGRRVGSFVLSVLNDQGQPTESMPTRFKDLLSAALAHAGPTIRNVYKPFLLLHDSAQCDETKPGTRRPEQQRRNAALMSSSLSVSVDGTPAKKARFLPSSPLASSPVAGAAEKEMESNSSQISEQSSLGHDAQCKCPPIFEFEEAASLPDLPFPLVMSESAIKGTYPDSHESMKKKPYIAFLLQFMTRLQGIGSRGVLLNFSTQTAVAFQRKDHKFYPLSRSSSDRKIQYLRMHPSRWALSISGPCFHRFLNDELCHLLQEHCPEKNDYLWIASRLLGPILFSSDYSMSEMHRVLDVVRNCDLGEKGLRPIELYENIKAAIVANFFNSALSTDEKLRLSELFQNCPSEAFEPELCCKLLLAALSDMKVSLTCNATREALRYSIIRCVGSASAESLNASVRMSYSFLHHLIGLISKQGDEHSSCVTLSKDILMSVHTLQNSLSLESGEASLFGNVFENCVFARVVLLLHCFGKSFPKYPKGFKLDDLLILGKCSNCDFAASADRPCKDCTDAATFDNFSAQEKISSLTVYKSEPSFPMLLELLIDFSTYKDGQSGVRFFVARTPELQSVDVVVVRSVTKQATVMKKQHEVTVWLMECKSSLMRHEDFTSVDLANLLFKEENPSQYRDVFLQISRAATYNGVPPKMEYSVQLVNRKWVPSVSTRPQLDRAAKSSERLFTRISVNCFDSSSDSIIFLPGLVANCHPNMYLPAGCKRCANLPKQLVDHFVGDHELYRKRKVLLGKLSKPSAVSLF